MPERIWRKGNTPPLLVGVPTCTITLEISMVTLKKMGMSLPQDPAIPLLGICPKEAHSYNKDICSTMFIAALFVIAWKQPRCPTTEEWIEKMWYIYTLEYCSAGKIGILKWIEVEETILSEVTQSHKDKQGITQAHVDFRNRVKDDYKPTIHTAREARKQGGS